MDVFNYVLDNAPVCEYKSLPAASPAHHSILQPALLAVYTSNVRDQGWCSCLIGGLLIAFFRHVDCILLCS